VDALTGKCIRHEWAQGGLAINLRSSRSKSLATVRKS
jgi:hypothetical protein